MYNFVIRNITNKYDFTELIKIFLSPDDFSAYTQEEFENISQAEKASGQTVYFNDILSEDKNLFKEQVSRSRYFTSFWTHIFSAEKRLNC